MNAAIVLGAMLVQAAVPQHSGPPYRLLGYGLEVPTPTAWRPLWVAGDEEQADLLEHDAYIRFEAGDAVVPGGAPPVIMVRAVRLRTRLRLDAFMQEYNAAESCSMTAYETRVGRHSRVVVGWGILGDERYRCVEAYAVSGHIGLVLSTHFPMSEATAARGRKLTKAIQALLSRVVVRE